MHMGTNYVLNAEANEDLIAESVIDIAKECISFGVKGVFVSSVVVNTRRKSTFISEHNKILQDKCATHQLHFIDNLNIKMSTSGRTVRLSRSGKDLYLSRSGKDLLMNNFL